MCHVISLCILEHFPYGLTVTAIWTLTPSHFSLFVHLYQCCFQLNIYSTLSFKPPHKGVQHIRNAFIYYYWQQHTETFIALSASNSRIKGFSALEIHLSLTTTHRNTYSTFSFKLPHKGVQRIRNAFIYYHWQQHTESLTALWASNSRIKGFIELEMYLFTITDRGTHTDTYSTLRTYRRAGHFPRPPGSWRHQSDCPAQQTRWRQKYQSPQKAAICWFAAETRSCFAARTCTDTTSVHYKQNFTLKGCVLGA